jgi:hypothetical protein
MACCPAANIISSASANADSSGVNSRANDWRAGVTQNGFTGYSFTDFVRQFKFSGASSGLSTIGAEALEA